MVHRHPWLPKVAFALVAGAACIAGCTVGKPNPDPPGTTYPFEPLPPSSYVPKVKNLLVGLPATADEIAKVTADAKALPGLIDGWMALPEFRGKMIEFFRNAFQQNNVSLENLLLAVGEIQAMGDPTTDSSRALRLAVMDSFALTAWDTVANGRPFNELMATGRYMLNPPLMSLMSYIDEYPMGDTPELSGISRLETRNAVDHYAYGPGQPTAEDTLDPASANYMVWRSTPMPPSCSSPVGFGTGTANPEKNYFYYPRLFGIVLGDTFSTESLPCVPKQTFIQTKSQFSDADWSAWRMVDIKPTDATTPETTPQFWDTVKFRTATELHLHTPRVGFMGTLAFQTNWPTNLSNSARVTANQSLIVAIGESINGEGAPPAAIGGAVDAVHVKPACAGCHNQLDPFRQFFRQSYSVFYHEQNDPTPQATPASFSIAGTTGTGTGVKDVAAILARHELLPLAWVQKLHFWANTLPADVNDPEMVRIAAAFKDSNYDFKTLVRELFSSPLITFASGTDTTRANGVVLSIARRDHFCAALSNRLKIADVCGTQTVTVTDTQAAVAAIAPLIPADAYQRGLALASLPTSPTMFFRATVEGICKAVADVVVDATDARFDSMKVKDSVAAMTETLMTLPTTDPRQAAAAGILSGHYDKAIAAGATPTEALRSTFTLACMSPSSVTIGL